MVSKITTTSIIVIVLFIGAAIGGYVVISRQKPALMSLPISQVTQGPQKGCGNNLCEEDETYDLCPSDCNLPSSIEPTLKRILITESDLPSSPAPNKEPWVKQIDGKIDEKYVSLAPKDIKPYTGWQVTYYPLPHDSLAWIEQMVLVYPLDKIKSAFNSINATLATIQKTISIQVVELPSPNLGEGSRAFKPAFQDGKERYVIVFYKKGFYETLTLSGTAFEYKVLEDIAKKAADKIQ